MEKTFTKRYAEFLQYNIHTGLYEFRSSADNSFFSIDPLRTKGAYRLKSETCYELTETPEGKILIEFMA